jgi:preprotein translocase subunit SecG
MGLFFGTVLTLLAIFLILLVLVQRGRGGGLAGALGGMGGSSAFGAKAGDVFTRITIITASIWILISLAAVLWAKHRGDVLGTETTAPAADAALDLIPQPKAGDKTGPAGARATGEADQETAAPPAGPAETPVPPADTE